MVTFPSHCLSRENPHEGISSTRNRGIQISKGSVLLFVVPNEMIPGI